MRGRGGVRSEGRREESFISQLTSPGTSAKNSRNGRCTFTANEKTLSSSTNLVSRGPDPSSREGSGTNRRGKGLGHARLQPTRALFPYQN